MAHIIGFPLLAERRTKKARWCGVFATLFAHTGRQLTRSRFPHRIWQRHSALLTAAGFVR